MYLKSIALSNIRRFVDKVKIDLSPQATILLAPNGVGKTTVFEAIELALSESVMRLSQEGTLSPFLSDGASDGSVCLRFSSSEVLIELNGRGETNRTGDVSLVSGTADPKHIGQLLRLTHLLDQRSISWLVGSNGKVAGRRLGLLPFGKDAVLANEALRGTQAMVTRQLNGARDTCAEWMHQLMVWQSALTARDHAAQFQAAPLRPIEELRQELLQSLRVSATDVPNSLGPLRDWVLQTLSEVEEDRRQQETLEVRMRGAVKTVDEYSNIMNDSQRVETQRIDARRRLSTLQEEEGVAVANEESARSKYVQLERIHVRRQELLRLSADLSATQAMLSSSTTSLTQANVALSAAQERHTAAQLSLATGKTLEAHHTELDNTRMELERRLDADHERESNLSRLQSKREEQQLAEARQSALQLAESELLTRHNHLHEEEQNAVGALARSIKRLGELSRASDALRDAIQQVALLIPDDQTDCPLCLHAYDPIELRDRIAVAIQFVEPEVASASAIKVQAEENLARVRAQLEEIQASAGHAHESLLQAEAKLETIRVELRQLERACSLGNLNIEQAREQILTSKAEASRELGRLSEERKSALARPSHDELRHLLHEEESTRLHVRELSAEIAKLEAEVSLANIDLVAATAQISSLDTWLSEMDSEVSSPETNFRIHLLNATEELQSIRQLKVDAERELTTIDAQHRLLVMRLDTVMASWSELQLDGLPSKDLLESGLDRNAEKLRELNRRIEAIHTARTELRRRDDAVAHEAAELNIRNLRGNRSENDYETLLRTSIALAESSEVSWSHTSDGIVVLTEELRHELETTRKHFDIVQTAWRGLLGRMVRDQRYISSEFSYYQYYGKDHADFSIPVSGRKTALNSVASEGQLADLQLSLLLSMARTYTWTPWRALLLDDPTQHHDMVHAAAVFDVLRDYVSELGFQLVLSTHSPVQARFLVRKLRNDGVDVSLLGLEQTKGGVQVRQMSRD